MAGAIYGVKSIPLSWIRTVEKWSGNTITARAIKLYEGKLVVPPSVEEIDRIRRLDLEFYESTVELHNK